MEVEDEDMGGGGGFNEEDEYKKLCAEFNLNQKAKPQSIYAELGIKDVGESDLSEDALLKELGVMEAIPPE